MKQDFQQQMQTLSPEFRELFQIAQMDEWRKIEFTSTAINELFPRYREFGLMYQTPISLNISPEYLVHLMHGNIETYFVSDIVTLCQAFEQRTFRDFMQVFGLKPEARQDFADFLSMAEQVTTEINAIVEPIKDRLVKKYQSMQALQLKAGGRKIELA